MDKASRYDSLFQFEAAAHGLDWRLLRAQCTIESNLSPAAQSPVGAKGLAQFTDATWAQWGMGDPFNPEQSIIAQAAYMAWLLKHYNNDIRHALAAYNWGVGHVDRLGDECAPLETRDYVHRVMAAYEALGG